MSKKVRVYELAKQYGMKGPELAKMLKEYGGFGIKSHMAVLDEATEMQVRGVLEAQGLKAKAVAVGTAVEKNDGVPKRKQLPTQAEPALVPKPKKSLTAVVDEPLEAEPAAGDAAEADSHKKKLPPQVPKPSRKKGGDAPVKTATGATTEAAAETEAATEAATEIEPPSETETTPVEAEREREPEPQREPETPVAATESTVVENQPAAVEPEQTKPADAAVETEEQPLVAEQTTPVDTAPPETAEAAADTGAAPAADTAPEAEPDKPDQKKVKPLIRPERRAKVVGRIELPQEAISDAKRRSAPATGRNPGGVDRNLRRRALSNTQTRSAARPGGRQGPGGRGPGGGVRRGPAGGRGRGGPGGGRGRGGPGGGRGSRRSGGGLTSTVDPNKLIEIEPPISIKSLSEAIGVKVNDLIAALTFKLGVVGKNINSFLSDYEVELVGDAVDRNIKIVQRAEAEEELLKGLVADSKDADQLSRAPVVTFMGHVDHGKTTLLDKLRASDVVTGEAGGITQHVGAYKITRDDGYEFVVLDTPGHEAFTAMRARGAKLTDIVILVVAADDGVMPQTEEAIAHAKDAEDTPIIVAINKCDRPEANPTQVKQQLSVKGLQSEDWGGKIQMIEVSATTGQGLDELVEAIRLESELLELSAKPTAAGEGIVIESKQTPEQGIVVNVLVTDGTVRVRDQVLCGESLARIRGIIDDHGSQIEEAGPSTPVQLLGATSLPSPGDKLYVVSDKKKAKEVVDDRQRAARKVELAERSERTKMATVDTLSATLEAKAVEETKLIIKADVMGSLQPIKTSLEKLNTDEVKVNIVHSALGGITEADVTFAEASGAVILGFNTVAETAARLAADRANVEIRYYDVIYKLIDEVKLIMEGMLKPEEIEEVKGHAEVKAVFRSSKFGNIAGLLVEDGLVSRNHRVRLSRDGAVVYTGTVASLRREKDDAREVKAGLECGLTLKDFNDIKVGDRLEFYGIKLVKRTLA